MPAALKGESESMS